MFREPEVTETKSAVKADSSAPARSSIRRHRFIRHPRDRSLPSSSSHSRPHRSDHRRALLAAIHRRHSPSASARSAASRVFDVEAAANRAHAEASLRRRFDNGRAILRDALSFERHGDSIVIPPEGTYALGPARPLTPPSPYLQRPPSRVGHRPLIRYNNDPGSRPNRSAGGARSPPPEYIPSPPYTLGDASDQSSSLQDLPTSYEVSSFTRRFAPAHPPSRIQELEEPDHTHPENEWPETDSMDVMPSWVRVNRRGGRETARVPRALRPRDDADGLGDRDRSLTPEPDEDSWETLLSTVTPDEHLPSLHSSFTSAAASASSFPSSEELAYYGSLAHPYSSDRNDPFLNACENTDSDGSELDDDGVVPVSDLTRRRPNLRDYRQSVDNASGETRNGSYRDRQGALPTNRGLRETREDLMRAELHRLRRHFPEEFSTPSEPERSNSRPERGRL
ncbi:MAG: hypothetical protein LQ342_005881 [Letrouitia transgressa]|nr:MAG: hypothetical protein LQ342_005881 [Letrouitia transgressa]